MTRCRPDAGVAAHRWRALAATWLALLLAACANVDPTADYERVAAEIRAATGAAQVYEPATDTGRGARVQALLDDGLELREAVEVALLNSPVLRAAFRDVGMARAERVQAGLLTNPSLNLALRLPTSGGPTGVEGGLFGSLLDVWQRPARIDAADATLERRVLEVAHRAVALAGAVRAAYIEAAAAERLQRIAERNRATAARLLELAESRVAARAATLIDANLAHLELSDTELALRDAELAVAEARRTLATHLGLAAWPAATALASALDEPSVPLPDRDRLTGLAMRHRLDVRAAEAARAQAAAEFDRQRGRLARRLGVGLAAEKEGDWSLGPGFWLELPVFDQNQAQIAKAAESLAQREESLAAVRLAVLQDLDTTRARVAASRDTARLCAEQLVPRARDTLEAARASYRSGKTTIVPVLEAQRRLLGARREYVVRLRRAATALSELERATGTPRERIFEISETPETPEEGVDR